MDPAPPRPRKAPAAPAPARARKASAAGEAPAAAPVRARKAPAAAADTAAAGAPAAPARARKAPAAAADPTAATRARKAPAATAPAAPSRARKAPAASTPAPARVRKAPAAATPAAPARVRKAPAARSAARPPASTGPVSFVKGSTVAEVALEPVDAAVVHVADPAPVEEPGAGAPAARTPDGVPADLAAPPVAPGGARGLTRRFGRVGVAVALAVAALLVAGGVVALVRSQSDSAQITDLAVGSCYDLGDGELTSARTRDCAEPHDVQVLADLDSEAEDFPGTDALNGEADRRCNEAAATFTAELEVPEDLGYGYLVPTEGSWEDGDRAITCTLVSTVTGGKLTGKVG